MNFAQEILKKINPPAEIYLVKTKTTKIDILNQKIESLDKLEETGCGIRVLKNNKMGFAYTSEFDDYIIYETIKQAIANADNSAEDEFNSFPKAATSKLSAEGLASFYDSKIAETPIDKKIALTLKIEQAARQDKRVKKTEKVSYEDSETEIWIVNSNGIKVNFKANFCAGIAQVIALSGKEAEMGLAMDFVTKFDKLNPEAIGKEAAKKANELLGARPIASKKMDLIIDPRIGSQILGALMHILSADAAQKGKSLFADKLKKRVASSIVNIIDNGRLEEKIGSSPFDAEGVPTEETELIKEGILQTFLYNTYTANKGKVRSNGKAARSSFKSPPGIGPTNLYIKSGKLPALQILNGAGKALYVTRVMGLHTINPISGDFSIGAAGILIKNGKEKQPVKGISIAGNLIDLLEKIEAVGSDLVFTANLGSPTLLVKDISVSGP